MSKRNALITGGANGIGREMAANLLDRNYRVWVLDCDTESLLQFRKEFSEQMDAGNLRIDLIDITDAEAVQNLRIKFEAQWGRLDLLINNAGIVRGGAFLHQPLNAHFRTIDVNLKALIAVTYEFLPLLMKTKDSKLIQMASVTGLMGLAYGTSYASSKWGVMGFTESLRQELRALKSPQPHLCVVCPSYIATGMFDGSKAPKLMPFLDPTSLAKKILNSAERKKHFVKEPFMVKTVPFLRTLLPLWAQDRILDWFGVAQGMSHWKGRESSKRLKQAS